MTEPTIACPNCMTEIRLTESFATPLIAATDKKYGSISSNCFTAILKHGQEANQ